jgi:hypothetical protein
MRNNEDEAKLSDPYCPPQRDCRALCNPFARILSFFGHIPNSPVKFAGMSEQTKREILYSND